MRSPRQAVRWWINDRRGPADFAIRPDWVLRCPRNAAERAFSLQIHDPPQVREFDDFVAYAKGAGKIVMLDIGCHFGCFCFAAVHYGGAGSRALGVDPSQEAHAMFDVIARLNGLEGRVAFLEAAAGATEGTMEMVDTGLTGAGYVVLPSDQPAADRRRLPVRTVDALAGEMGEVPNLVKVDVEGFEGEVLRGGQKTFGERGTPLFLELHNAMVRARGLAPEDIVGQLRDYGYRSFQIGGREVSPGELTQGEIVRFLARRIRAA